MKSTTHITNILNDRVMDLSVIALALCFFLNSVVSQFLPPCLSVRRAAAMIDEAA